MKHLSPILLLFFVPSPLFAAFTLIDNFDNFLTGTLGGQNGWNTTNGNWTVATAPAGGSGNVASGLTTPGNSAAWKALSPVIDNTNVASTLFFRLYRTDGVNMSAGLSDETTPVLFTGYETQLNAQHNAVGGPTDSFKVRDAGVFDDLGAGTFAINTWYNVWMVVNNSANTFELYMNQGDFGTEGTSQIHIGDPGAGDFTFGFRNGAAVNPLNTVIFAMGGANVTGSMLVDDVYLDQSGQNLVNPVPEPGSAFLLGAAATLGLASRRRNRRA